MNTVTRNKNAGLGCLLWLIMIAMAVIFFSSCQKQTDYSYLNTDRRGLIKYQLWIDHYSFDTSKSGTRTLAWQAHLPFDRNGGADTIQNHVFLNCITDSIEHWYYMRNDSMLFKSTVPMLKPTRIDTIFTNYNKQ